MILIYDENSYKEYLLEDVQYPKHLRDLHNDLPFLPERMNLKKCNKFVCSFYDKINYVFHRRTLKQLLNHG